MDLVLLACLAASPGSCREERLAVSFEQADPRVCMVGAMPVIAEWAGEHPDYTVTRWRCDASGAPRMTRNFGGADTPPAP